jgi:succinate CoA transferase
MPYAHLTPAEAAALIRHGDTVGFSGFTPAGSPKVIPLALAERAKAEHAAGRPYQIGVLTGASTGKSLDGSLAKADAVSFRSPYQSDNDMRAAINAGRVRFFDMHLSMFPQNVRYGFLGKVNWAIIEACDINDQGEIVLTTGVGAAPTFALVADKILIELNRAHPAGLRGFHDIYTPGDPPNRGPIPLTRVSDRIGRQVVKIPPEKIIGVIESNMDDETGAFRECDEVTKRIGFNVAEFLAAEMKAGRIPKTFLPIQSGVGETANAVLFALGDHPAIPAFEMYTEVIQDAVIDLMKHDKIKFASGSSLTISPEVRKQVYGDLEFFRERTVLRPQEVSNHPEVVRRLGILSCNTALEVDIAGNVNSTHVMGSKMMNGIGGSGDFTRNAYISMFICPSVAKAGKISTIVPMVSHADHNEHSVQIIITEQGVADLRGKSPQERAQIIIEKCAHPEYRESLKDYVEQSGVAHSPQAVAAAFGMHEQFNKTGDMHGVAW